MVSLDSPETNRAFAKSVDADIGILSDPDGDATRAFGALAPGGKYARRRTVYIGRDALIRRIDDEVSPSSHGSDIVRMLGQWFEKDDAR